ncbi:MAG: hypothetical protein ICV73_08510 [Acetobacteraceae bacterium]|nr:hypothetical protein [Acetobacteraceae bacterium]
MLRNLALAFVGASLLAGPAAARGDGPNGGRWGEAKAYTSAKAEQQPSSPLLRRVATAATVRPVAESGAGTCGRPSRGQAKRCRGAGQLVNAGGGWARGLPPALGVQAQQCPPGTMATLAQGHDDIVRCVPV